MKLKALEYTAKFRGSDFWFVRKTDKDGWMVLLDGNYPFDKKKKNFIRLGLPDEHYVNCLFRSAQAAAVAVEKAFSKLTPAEIQNSLRESRKTEKGKK